MKKQPSTIHYYNINSIKYRYILKVYNVMSLELDHPKISDLPQKKTIEIIKEAMENVLPREFLANLDPVPLKVSVEVGPNWGELK